MKQDTEAKAASVEAIKDACAGQCTEQQAKMIAGSYSGADILHALDRLKLAEQREDIGNVRQYLMGILRSEGATAAGKGNAKLDYYTATDWERWQCLLTTINLRMGAIAGTGPLPPPKFDRLCAIASGLGASHDCEAARRALLQEAET